MATQTKQHKRSKAEHDSLEDALDDLKQRDPFNQLIDIEESEGSGTDHARKDLKALKYSELQDIAKGLDIKANQTTEDLIDAILDGDAGEWIFTVKRSSNDFDLD